MSTLVLTPGEQAALTGATEALLSPIGYEGFDAWAAAAAEGVRSLVGAERCVLLVPSNSHTLVSSRGYPAELIQVYQERTAPMDRRYRFLDRGLRLGSYCREELWGPHLEQYRRSAYYNDFIRPNGFFGGVGLMTRTEAPVSIDTVAQMLAHSDAPLLPERALRASRLLGLVLPAFRSAVQAVRILHAHHRDIGSFIDELRDGVEVFDVAGNGLHRNERLARLLEADPQADDLLDAIRDLARRLCGRGADAARSSATLRTARGRYRLHATRLPAGLLAPLPAVAVIIRPGGARLPGAETLQDRFDLTPREATVALLLAERKTGREIADRLGISYHTARRHTERVLLKLNVGSRRDVRGRITSLR